MTLAGHILGLRATLQRILHRRARLAAAQRARAEALAEVERAKQRRDSRRQHAAEMRARSATKAQLLAEVAR